MIPLITTGASSVVGVPPDIRDVVVQMRDGRLILIRRIEKCPDVVVAIGSSADVAKAECFK